jgi:hypothetical protein
MDPVPEVRAVTATKAPRARTMTGRRGSLPRAKVGRCWRCGSTKVRVVFRRGARVYICVPCIDDTRRVTPLAHQP